MIPYWWDDAAASLMVNTIHAKGDGWEDSSAQASDDNAEDFMLDVMRLRREGYSCAS